MVLSFAQKIYGPIFIGVVFNALLYGVSITQTYLYFNRYKTDGKWTKLLVLVLFTCDTVNTSFDIAFTYDPLINLFGDQDAILKASWVFATDPLTTAIIAFLVQLFYAWRVKVLTSNWCAIVAIGICAVVQFLSGIGCFIALRMLPEFLELRRFKVIVIIWLGSAAIADILITAVLVMHLRRNKTGMTVTDNTINKIIRLTVQTGLLTAIFAIMDVSSFLISTSGWHLTFNISLAKLYTNSLLSTLNSRRGWQFESIDGGSTEQQVNMLRDNARRGPPQIYVDVESHQMIDIMPVKAKHHTSMVSFLPDKKTMSSVSLAERRKRNSSMLGVGSLALGIDILILTA